MRWQREKPVLKWSICKSNLFAYETPQRKARLLLLPFHILAPTKNDDDYIQKDFQSAVVGVFYSLSLVLAYP